MHQQVQVQRAKHDNGQRVSHRTVIKCKEAQEPSTRQKARDTAYLAKKVVTYKEGDGYA